MSAVQMLILTKHCFCLNKTLIIFLNFIQSLSKESQETRGTDCQVYVDSRILA